MTYLERIGLRGRLDLYEKISVVGILFTVFGSTMGWITVEATADAAVQHDDIDAGTTVFTGLDLSWGEITLYLAIVAAVVLGLVLWRYRAPGRITGLLVMLVGLVTAGVAVIGIVLTGMIYSPTGNLEGVSVGVGLGLFVTLLGALLMLSGGGAPARHWTAFEWGLRVHSVIPMRVVYRCPDCPSGQNTTYPVGCKPRPFVMRTD